MLRTTLNFCLLFSCCVVGYAADDNVVPAQKTEAPAILPDGWLSNAMPSVLKKKAPAPLAAELAPEKRFDRNLSPAVHVNSTGLENTYGSRESSGAVNRLKSLRDTPLLGPRNASSLKQGAKKVLKQPRPGIVTQPGSSRRAKKVSPRASQDTAAADKVTPVAPAKTAPKIQAPALRTESKSKVELPSVVTRRGLAEPTLAMPAAAAPAKLPTPAAPIVEEPTLAVPTLAFEKPAFSVATTQPATLVDQSAAFETNTPRLASRPAGPVTSSLGTQGSAATTQPLTAIPTQPKALVITPKQPVVMRGESSNQVAIPSGTNTNPAQQQRSSRATRPRLRTQASTAQASTAKPAEEKPVHNPARRTTADEDDNVLLANRSPVLVVKTHGPTKIRVGRTATYHVTAANKGDLLAEDVMVSVNVPNWAELTRNQSTSGAVRVEPNLNGDNVLQWTIRDLKPGSQQRLRLDLVPRASRPIELGVTWNMKSVSAMAQIEVEEPKLKIAVVGPADMRFGDTKLYTITVSNPGSGDAENVMLTLLPVNNNGGTAGERELGVIKAGTQRTIEVELTARQAGELAIRAHASADGGLRAEGEQPVLVRRPNLVIEAAGPAKRYAGTAARYAIKVTNNGDATARDVTASAGLPMGAKFVKSSQNGIFDKNRNLVQWDLGALRPGAYQIVEVTTILNGSGASKLAARTGAKLDQLNAAATAVTQVEALADLKLSVVDPVGPVPLDTEVAYEIKVENRGTKAAHNINIVGYFSEGIEPVSVQGWQGEVEIGQVMLETIPRVSPGQRMVIKVVAKATRAGNHVFRTELDSEDQNTKTKLAVEEWTVFHSEQDLVPGLDDAPVQQADNSDTLSLEPFQR